MNSKEQINGLLLNKKSDIKSFHLDKPFNPLNIDTLFGMSANFSGLILIQNCTLHDLDMFCIYLQLSNYRISLKYSDDNNSTVDYEYLKLIPTGNGKNSTLTDFPGSIFKKYIIVHGKNKVDYKKMYEKEISEANYKNGESGVETPVINPKDKISLYNLLFIAITFGMDINTLPYAFNKFRVSAKDILSETYDDLNFFNIVTAKNKSAREELSEIARIYSESEMTIPGLQEGINHLLDNLDNKTRTTAELLIEEFMNRKNRKKSQKKY